MRHRIVWNDPPTGCWQGYCALMVTKNVPTGATHYLVDEKDAPSDRTFRNAWECPDGVIHVDMSKARDIHMDRIRMVRNVELAALDVAFMLAVEAGDTDAQSKIGAEKQLLRDIPQTFDLTARTPQQLKSKWPSELPPRTS